jgi:hypothetical protein
VVEVLRDLLVCIFKLLCFFLFVGLQDFDKLDKLNGKVASRLIGHLDWVRLDHWNFWHIDAGSLGQLLFLILLVLLRWIGVFIFGTLIHYLQIECYLLRLNIGLALNVNLPWPILLLLFLSKRRILLHCLGILLPLGLLHLFLRLGRDQLKEDFICVDAWLVLMEVALQRIGAINNVELASPLLDTIDKVACIAETVCLLQLAQTIYHALVDSPREVTSIGIVNLPISLRLVILKVTLDDHTISVEELAEARSDIEVPRALVELFPVVAFAIGDLSLAVAFSIVELTCILCAIFVEASA